MKKLRQNSNKETSSGNAMPIERNNERVYKIEDDVIEESVKHQPSYFNAR